MNNSTDSGNGGGINGGISSGIDDGTALATRYAPTSYYCFIYFFKMDVSVECRRIA